MGSRDSLLERAAPPFESGVASREPGVRSPEPQARSQEPGVRSQESKVRSQTPGAQSQEAKARRPKSGVRKLEPGVRSPESGARSPESTPSRLLTPYLGLRAPNSRGGGAFEQSNPRKFPHIYGHSEMSIYSACAVGARGELPSDTTRPSANR